MTQFYNSGGDLGKQLRRLGLMALLAGGTALASQAQALNYTIAGGTNVTSTYTDLGTNGTAIATANTDDANSTVQNIGFTFAYNNTTFTQFCLNTNGFIKLGTTAPSATMMYLPEAASSTVVNPFVSASDPNIIAPFNFDLAAGSAGSTEYRVYTAGTAGSRICTIQWKNVADKSGTYLNQYGNMSFQIRLYEATGVVEFVYGTAMQGTNPDDYRSAQIGLKGNSFADGQLVQVAKLSADAWSAATFVNYATAVANQAYNVYNFRGTVVPAAGRTYRFTPLAPPVASDAAITAVYTLGKLPVPAALPHAVQAVITNLGTSAFTNLAVTLNVTGANTFSNTQTIPSLASGTATTVTFANYPATLAAGVNTVTVTVPSDGNNANNSTVVQQTVNTSGTFSYVPANLANTPDNTSGGLGANDPTSGLIFAAKYTTMTAGKVGAVSAFIQDPNTVGKTLYGVVLSPTGTILGQSANYVVQASDINAYHTFSISTPPAVTANGSFLAGMAQAAQSASIFPMGAQPEVPGRAATFYITGLTGGALTDVNVGGGTYRFMLEASVTAALATSKELQRAITLYPNPSESGVFNLDIHSANAMGSLGVEVTNQLGQRVYTGSARDNYTTKLDLSSLAAGIYHMQVRNGDEFMSSQISIAK